MNNREIKFRAFYHDTMLYPHWLELTTPVHIYKDNDICIGWEPSVHLMQFTGLLDKNGNEVFEGDILIHKESNPIKMVCKWKQDMFSAGFIFETLDGKSYKNSTGLYYEVIGNIYENPELLAKEDTNGE